MKTAEMTNESPPPSANQPAVQAGSTAPGRPGKQILPPRGPQFEHVQTFLERDPALRECLGERTHEVETRNGEKRRYSLEVVAVAEALYRENKDAAKATKGEILSMGCRVLISKTVDPATVEPGAAAVEATAPNDSGARAGLDQAQPPGPHKTEEPAPASVLMQISLDQIDLEAGTESRELNLEVVKEYTEAWEHEAKFPPVQVFHEGKEGAKYFLADGFHRVASAKKAGHTTIEAEVFQGGPLEALEKSLGSNDKHGYRRTTADKEYAVRKAFLKFGDWSNRVIATKCGVSPTFVGKCRMTEEQASTVHVDSSAEAEPKKRRGRDGKSRRVPKRPKTSKAQESSEDTQTTDPTCEEGASESAGDAGQADRLAGLRELVEQVQLGLASALEENLQEGVTEILREHLVWCRVKWKGLSGHDDWPADSELPRAGTIR